MELSDNKLPPANIEAEEAILGCILMDENAISRVSYDLIPEAFYIPSHGKVYKIMLFLYEHNKPTDLLSVINILQEKKLLKEVGGRIKLSSLIERTVSSVNIDKLAEIVIEKYIRRKLIAATRISLAIAQDEWVDLEECLEKVEKTIFEVRNHRSTSDYRLTKLQEIAAEVYDDLENVDNLASAVKTGYYDLDLLLGGGLRGGQLIIVCGRPGMGKSMFADSILYQIVNSNRDNSGLLYSLEMKKTEIVKRYLSWQSQVESSQIEQKKIKESDWFKLSSAIASMSELNLYINDNPNINIETIKAESRHHHSKSKLSLIVIDYLQIMVSNDDGDKNRNQLGNITGNLKKLSRELDVPIILLSQLNRGVESRTNKRPFLSDLRECGKIEEDADIVLGLYRDEYYNPETFDKDLIEINILKHRSGSLGQIKLLFEPRICGFKNIVSRVTM